MNLILIWAILVLIYFLTLLFVTLNDSAIFVQLRFVNAVQFKLDSGFQRVILGYQDKMKHDDAR